MSGGDLLNVSVSGLNLSQTALRTAGHNIANANTEGYTRQSVLSAANPALYTGAGFLGNGVEVSNITRQANEFVINQWRTDTALFNQQQTYLDAAEQLDNVLANPSLGLSDALQRFFNALQAGADDPTSIASRQLIVSEGQSLVDRFNTLHDRLTTIEGNVIQQMSITVSSANGLLNSIASLNASIARASGGTNGEPNDLLDRRDQALLELSELVGVRVNHLSDGQVNVSLVGGQSLILGDRVNTLALIDSPEKLGQKDLAVSNNGQFSVVNQEIAGGKLAGYIEYRESMLSPAFNNIGRMAIALAGTMNTLHEQGMDLNGEFGKRMFFDINDENATSLRVLHGPENKPPYNRELTLKITDITQLTGSNYRVEIEEGSQRFSIVRESDGVEVVSNLLTGRTPQNVEFDGLKMTFEGGVFQQGDRFYLQPTRDAAREMSFDIQDPEALAFSKPLIAESVIGNLGNGAITLGELISVSNVSAGELPLFDIPGKMDPPLVVRFTSPTRYEILDNSNPAAPTPLDPPIKNQLFIPNQDNPLFSTAPGETMLVANGDRLGINSINSQDDTLNGYPAERFIFAIPPSSTGATEQQVVVPANSSVDQLAVLLGNVPGVEVNAWTEVNLANVSFDGGALPSLTLNGIDLLEYELDGLGATVIGSGVPDPSAETNAFLDYLADRINQLFSGESVTADVTTVNGSRVLNVLDANGRDLQVAVANARLDLNDGVTDSDNNGVLDSVALGDAVDPEQRTIGGRFTITLAEEVSLETVPTPSKLMGALDAKPTFLGIQAILSGNPKAGDGFTLKFNSDAYGDNRNALSMVNVELMGLISGGKMTLGDAYGVIIEDVGIKTSTAKINAKASEGVMQQSESLRNSMAAVNLDEEAANLIKFEQMYSANAQAISIARSIFDRLLNSF